MHFSAICGLAVEIHCNVGHDASITAISMPRCGELSFSVRKALFRDAEMTIKIIVERSSQKGGRQGVRNRGQQGTPT